MNHFIPIVTGIKEYLPKALDGCKSLWDNTIIIDNRDNNEDLKIDLRNFIDEKIKIYTPPVPLTTAQSMNLMLKLSLEDKFFTWQHLDAVCLNTTSTDLYKIVNDLIEKNEKWGVVFTNYDTYCAYNVKALKDVNGWDWKKYPYYFLDTDLHDKLKNKGYKLINTGLPVYHKKSQTINSSQERLLINKAFFKASKELYDKSRKK